MCTLYLTFLLKRWRKDKYHQHVSRQKQWPTVRFSNSITKILDSTLTLLRSRNKDANTLAAIVEYCMTYCLYEQWLCRCCWYREILTTIISPMNVYRAVFNSALQRIIQWLCSKLCITPAPSPLPLLLPPPVHQYLL